LLVVKVVMILLAIVRKVFVKGLPMILSVMGSRTMRHSSKVITTLMVAYQHWVWSRLLLYQEWGGGSPLTVPPWAMTGGALLVRVLRGTMAWMNRVGSGGDTVLTSAIG
jgi:hypothetical protein